MRGEKPARRRALLAVLGLLLAGAVRYERRAPAAFDCPETPIALSTEGVNVRLICRDAAPISVPPMNEPTLLLATAASAGGYRAVPMPVSARRTMGLPVDLNRMSREDFEQLPGIGPALSKRIIATRRELGGFTAIDDLALVPGIGPAKLNALRSLLEGSGR